MHQHPPVVLALTSLLSLFNAPHTSHTHHTFTQQQVRCIISGPQDTPYEGGLFVFDVFFPEGYPNVPPLMVLETTGEGRARFNPNLYAGVIVGVGCEVCGVGCVFLSPTNTTAHPNPPTHLSTHQQPYMCFPPQSLPHPHTPNNPTP